MTKQQLAEEMAKDAKISKAAALKAIDSMTTNIKKRDFLIKMNYNMFLFVH